MNNLLAVVGSSGTDFHTGSFLPSDDSGQIVADYIAVAPYYSAAEVDWTADFFVSSFAIPFFLYLPAIFFFVAIASDTEFPIADTVAEAAFAAEGEPAVVGRPTAVAVAEPIDSDGFAPAHIDQIAPEFADLNDTDFVYDS